MRNEFTVSMKICYKGIWCTVREESEGANDEAHRDRVIARAKGRIDEFVKDRDEAIKRAASKNDKFERDAKLVAEILDAACPHDAKSTSEYITEWIIAGGKITMRFNRFSSETPSGICFDKLTPPNALFRLLMMKRIREAVANTSDEAQKFANKLIIKRDKEAVEIAKVLNILDLILQFKKSCGTKNQYRHSRSTDSYDFKNEVQLIIHKDAMVIEAWCYHHSNASCAKWKGKIPNPAQLLEALAAHESFAAILTNPKFKPEEEVSDERLAEFSL